MKAIKAVSVIIIVTIISAWLLVQYLTVDIPIGKVGVRIQQYGILGKKGVVAHDYRPGWHRDLGPIDNWEMFDSTVQTLEMTREPQRGSVQGRDDVQVQSADGYAISVDVTVKYKIMPGTAHKLYQDTGSGIKYRAIVRNEAQKACMEFFGGMKTEDFYNPARRRARAEEIKTMLISSLADNFVEVIDVAIEVGPAHGAVAAVDLTGDEIEPQVAKGPDLELFDGGCHQRDGRRAEVGVVNGQDEGAQAGAARRR